MQHALENLTAIDYELIGTLTAWVDDQEKGPLHEGVADRKPPPEALASLMSRALSCV